MTPIIALHRRAKETVVAKKTAKKKVAKKAAAKKAPTKKKTTKKTESAGEDKDKEA